MMPRARGSRIKANRRRVKAMRNDPEHQKLISLAREQVIGDPDVAECWYYVIEALDNRWLGLDNLYELTVALKRGHSRGYQEIDFDWSDDDPTHLVLTFVGDEFTCSSERMVTELERLIRRFHDEPEPARASEGSVPDLLDFLAGLLGTTPDIMAGGDIEGYRQRMRDLVSRVQDMVDAMQSQDPVVRDAARERAEALRAELQAHGISAAERLEQLSPELRRALRSAEQIDAKSIAETLRTLAQWLDRQDEDSGRQVDALVAAMKQAGDAFLGESVETREGASRERMHAAARSSIAARLRQAGATPAGPESDGEQE